MKFLGEFCSLAYIFFLKLNGLVVSWQYSRHFSRCILVSPLVLFSLVILYYKQSNLIWIEKLGYVFVEKIYWEIILILPGWNQTGLVSTFYERTVTHKWLEWIFLEGNRRPQRLAVRTLAIQRRNSLYSKACFPHGS